jgi:hypothetical protein
MTGNLGMAKAGMGDVLTGTIVAMYGIGYRDVGEATRVEVLVHGLAGDLAAKDLGENDVTPDDVIQYLPKTLKILREERSPPAKTCNYLWIAVITWQVAHHATPEPPHRSSSPLVA